MKTVIYFLRHCEPDTLARDDLLQPLTPKGMHDAVEAAGFLEGRGICAIWSSDALRAIQTVQAFAQLSGLGIRRDARLPRRSAGLCTGGESGLQPCPVGIRCFHFLSGKALIMCAAGCGCYAGDPFCSQGWDSPGMYTLYRTVCTDQQF